MIKIFQKWSQKEKDKKAWKVTLKKKVQKVREKWIFIKTLKIIFSLIILKINDSLCWNSRDFRFTKSN